MIAARSLLVDRRCSPQRRNQRLRSTQKKVEFGSPSRRRHGKTEIRRPRTAKKGRKKVRFIAAFQSEVLLGRCCVVNGKALERYEQLEGGEKGRPREGRHNHSSGTKEGAKNAHD